MANTNAPFGFRPAHAVRYMTVMDKATAAAIVPGDLVTMRADGRAIRATAGAVELIGASMSYARSTDTTVIVCNDPDQKYWVQISGVTGGAKTTIGLNADILATAFNTTTLRSKMTVDST